MLAIKSEEKSAGTSRVALICIALFVITLTVFWQVGDHDFLNVDDDIYIVDNSHVAKGITGSNIIWAFTSVDASNWHPITWLSHMADAQLYGMKPRGHHLTNVVIHAVSALLLFLLFSRLTGSPWQSSFVAALFALHPLHVESVAWVAERKDVVSAFFWFLTLHLYSEYVAERKLALYLLSLFSFVLGLMSKPMLVSLPLVMMLMDFWPLNRYSLKEQDPRLRHLSGNIIAFLKEKIPFLLCAFFSAAITIYAQQKGESIRGLYDISFGHRIENAIVAYVRYIAKTFWPHDLAILYPFPSSIPLWQVISSMLFLLLVSAATIRAGRQYPFLAVGWFWFLITLVPVIGLVQVGSQAIADRYTYIPLTGLFIMAAWGVPTLAKRLHYRQGILALIAGVVVLASATATWHQLGYWQDSISLYRHTLQITSDNHFIHYNLAIALKTNGDLDGAITEYQKALTIKPNYIDAHNNLGVVFAIKGDLDAAIKEFQKALSISPYNVNAYNNLKIALEQKRRQAKNGGNLGTQQKP